MNNPAFLDIDKTALIIIDMQEKLFPVMQEKEKLLRNIVKLIKGTQVLDIPVLFTEQYPRGLGPTLPEIRELVPDFQLVEKVNFNCCDEAAFCRALEALKKKQVLIAGIESHICVYQTAVALARAGYAVQVVADGAASREAENKMVALFKMGAAGISPTTVEMVLFELLKFASGDKFKLISNIVK